MRYTAPDLEQHPAEAPANAQAREDLEQRARIARLCREGKFTAGELDMLLNRRAVEMEEARKLVGLFGFSSKAVSRQGIAWIVNGESACQEAEARERARALGELRAFRARHGITGPFTTAWDRQRAELRARLDQER